jgi:dTDP-6-deoxy-L-talose 4-dehydrogenase (NAD+)
MNILVTGASGFIGKHVVSNLLKLQSLNITVSSSNIKNLEELYSENKITIIPFDIYNNENEEIDLFSYFGKPDKLIHLAWKGLPNYGKSFHVTENLPKEYKFISNLIKGGLKDITIAGTCFEYGMQVGELHEEMATNPINFYSLAKDTLRKMLEILKVDTSFNLKWVRFFYMYGEGQNPNSLIAQLDKAIDENANEFKMSGGMQIRDYMHVYQVAENLVKITLQNEINGIINNCSGIPVKLIDFVNEYLLKRKKEINLNLGYYPYSIFEPMDFWGNNDKLNKILKG